MTFAFSELLGCNTATNAAEADSRVLEYSYEHSIDEDVATLDAQTPRLTTEKLKSSVVGQEAVALWPNNTLYSRFAAPGAGNNYVWPSNLTTIVTESTLSNGRLTRTILPDLTATFNYALTNNDGSILTNSTTYDIVSGKTLDQQTYSYFGENNSS